MSRPTPSQWRAHEAFLERKRRRRTRVLPIAIGVALILVIGPMFPIVVFLVALLIVLTIVLWRIATGSKIGDTPLGDPWECRRCGYDLRNLDADRCPECGRAAPSSPTVDP